MNYYLAVDGGGTKTQVLCADENGEIVGEGLSGPTSLTVVNSGAAGFALREAIRQATENLPPGFVVTRLVMGLAGLDTPEEISRAESSFKQVIADIQVKDFVLINDIMIALRAASDKQDAMALIAGTGSNCFGINAEGESAKAGGLDFLLSDEGSGYSIGAKVLKAAAMSFDGRGAKTRLEQLTNDYFETSSIPEVKHHIYNPVLTKMQVAGLAKLAFDALEEGDEVAHQIVDRAADDLFVMAKVVIEKLRLNERPSDCVFSGKVLLSDYLKNKLKEKINQEYPNIQVLIPEDEPVYGALKIALSS
ncbi:hypothetical protein KJZ63_01430 [Patescibacteria group bacterium]|nr:hypothetical protein [Patescibacteria group bacterium]